MSNMKKALVITTGAIIGVFVLLVIIGTIIGSKPPAASPAANQQATAPAAPATHTAAPVTRTTPAAGPITVTRTTTRVVFKVWGTGTPSIMYGSDSDNLSPSGNLGPLGDGNALPWKATMPYRDGALYYMVNAQLEGGGDIRCSVGIRVTDYYSDGTHISRGKVVERGHAIGGYNICDAQANN
jgi:hypothetical protein